MVILIKACLRKRQKKLNQITAIVPQNVPVRQVSSKKLHKEDFNTSIILQDFSRDISMVVDTTIVKSKTFTPAITPNSSHLDQTQGQEQSYLSQDVTKIEDESVDNLGTQTVKRVSFNERGLIKSKKSSYRNIRKAASRYSELSSEQLGQSADQQYQSAELLD